MQDYIKNLVKGSKLDKTKIDNHIFKLHYKVTVIMLVVFCILLSCKQFFGDPISCDVDKKKEIVDVFCWISGTFVIDKNIGDLQAPGLGNDYSGKPEDITRLLYYQWIFVFFCLQAVCFYLPRYLWKNWEGGLLSHIVKDLTDPIVSEKWTGLAREKLINYFLSSRNRHNLYAIRYTSCEALNLLNVILQVCIVDWYLGGKFSSYGLRVSKNMVNTMNSVFPKLTKCMYHSYGPSGSLQSLDALCVLPLNILNEKFFVVLWYWFFILMFITAFTLVYRGLFLFWNQFRMHLLRAQTRNVDVDRKKVQMIVSEISFGDFYVLYRMGQNLNPAIYREIILGIYDHLTLKKPLRSYPPHLSVV